MLNINLLTNNGRKSIFVSEDSTIREILEENDVNYAVGVTQVDGCSLHPGDMDKTLADFGITDSCYISCVLKLDNAAKVTVIGDATVITSALKLEDIKTAKKYRPDALKLFKDDKKTEQIFGVDVTNRSSGHFNANGATFSETADKDGYATITLAISERGEDVEKKVVDELGMGLLRLKQVEEGFGAQLEGIRADQAAIKALIQVC